MFDVSRRSPNLGPTPIPNTPLRVGALVGSLRQASLNRALLEAAREVAPVGLVIEPIEIGDLPFYDADLEARGDPHPVHRLKAAIAGADALLIVTPEYNGSLPAVLKNAIDWASRPSSSLAGKPILLMGAGPGRSGAENALSHLAEVLTHIRAVPFERRLGVARAGDLVDADGRLSDPALRAAVATLLGDFGRAVRAGEARVIAA